MQLHYFIYDMLMKFLSGSVKGISAVFPHKEESKISRFISLQKNIDGDIEKGANLLSGTYKKIWFHASSLGEYQIARPIMEELKKSGNVKIILTFFSPTGIEALKEKPTPADIIMPLPFDTKKNVKNFLDAIQPDRAVFLVSELWPNYIKELERRNLPTVLYSALMLKSPGSLSIKGNLKLSMIKKLNKVVVHDNKSLKNLKEKGCRIVELLPDPLFDNALSMAETPYSNPLIEKFISSARNVIVAGSLHEDEDMEIIAALAKNTTDTKFIIVPHEIKSSFMEKLSALLPEKFIKYSEGEENSDLTSSRFLVIDYIGDLAKIYRYGDAAYVGGGFTRLLHSVVEPLAYGLPVAFGPNIYRKSLPSIMIEKGIGTIVETPQEACRWWEKIKNNDKSSIKEATYEICSENRGGGLKGASLIMHPDEA